MGMLEHRFEGEKNLAKKLEGFDYGDTASGLPSFDTIQNQTPKKSFFWSFIKTLSIISVLGILMFVFVFENSIDSIINEQQKEVVNITDGKEQDGQVQDGRNTKIGQQAESSTLNLEKESAIVSNISQQFESSDLILEKESARVTPNEAEENESFTNTTTATNSSLSNNKGGTIKKRQINQLSEVLNIQKEDINEDKAFGFNSDNEVLSNEGNKRKKENETSGLQLNRTQENCYALFSPLSLLENKMTLFEGLIVETEPIIVENNPRRGMSFGIQYNRGKTHAGAHETPFVSRFPTTIKGGESFGYGFFGYVNLDKRNSIRPSFTYMKNTHLQFIDGLKFQTGPTGINMELYSHELKFGIDYAFNFLPNFKRFDVKAGVGLAYHKIISLSSNNYYTEAPEIVKNANELDLSPLSYKIFLALDVPIYKGLVFGIEPFIIYQKRTARYTPSTFIADQGDYNLISGINLTMRF